MFDQKQLLRSQQILNDWGLTQQEYQENQFAAAMREQDRQTEKLLQDRLTFWGITCRDGAVMSAVKASMLELNQQMRQPISQEPGAFQQEYQNVLDSYTRLIANCKRYTASHRHPITTSSKARLALVRRTLLQAESELRHLPVAVQTLQETGQDNLIWGNILGMAREMDLDLDKADHVEQGGAGTSDVTIISTGQSKLFFKENEQLRTSEDEIQRLYIDNCTDETDLSIYRELKTLMVSDPCQLSAITFNNANIRKQITSPDPNEQEMGFTQLAQMMQAVPECTLDFSQPRVREILKELLPRFSKWFTRSHVCETASIEAGSYLSNRNVATTRMAQLLNISSLIPLSCTARMHSQQSPQECHGVVMAQAKGVPLSDLLQKKLPVVYTPEAIRQLSQLQLFDTICGQIDRNLSNRFVTYKEVNNQIQITGIQGIDNDMAFGRMNYHELNRTVDGTYQLPVFENNKRCTLPALDGNLVASLFALSDEVVRHTMGDLLSEEDIRALLDRIAGVRETIYTSMQDNPQLVVESDHWDNRVAARFNEKQVNKSYADFSTDSNQKKFCRIDDGV